MGVTGVFGTPPKKIQIIKKWVGYELRGCQVDLLYFLINSKTQNQFGQK